MLNLRPYQRECLDSIKSHQQSGHHRQLISLPTGAGKTVIFAHLIKELGGRALVLAHKSELLQQAKDKIEMVCPDLHVGIVNGYSKEFDASVVVSSIQSARIDQNLDELKRQGFKVLIYDECHHSVSDTSRMVLDELGFGTQTDRLLVGFTATAFRNDGKGLGEIFDVISCERTIKEMIEDSYLCRPIGIKVATDLDLSKVKTSDGDFQVASLASVMDTPEINQLVVDSYIKEGENRKSICFSVSVQHAHNLAILFRKHGVSAQAIFGEMPKQERASILKDYQEGHIRVLSNCQVLTEGFDAPDTSCILVARPTQSKGLYQQMVGRGLRLYPHKKDCLVLDICDRNHSICNSATLLLDADDIETQDREAKEKSKEILERLPPNLNQKLKSALVSFDPLGEFFTWSLNESIYVLKGANNTRLGIVPTGENRYRVILASDNGNKIIADGLSFEYAFAAGEDFARQNRKMFIVCDREALWRNQPITEKQISLFRFYRYRSGIEQLTRGQASDLIGSGALRRAG